MRYYTFGDGVVIKAITPEHATARAFGGKPTDYIASERKSSEWCLNDWHEITSASNGDFLADAWILTDDEVAEHRRQGSL